MYALIRTTRERCGASCAGSSPTSASRPSKLPTARGAGPPTRPIPTLCRLIDWKPVMDGYTFITNVRANPDWRDIT